MKQIIAQKNHLEQNQCRSKKADVNITQMNQVVGHAVVTSFIHKYRHKALSLSCETGEFVAFYDYIDDILLHLLPIKWNNYSELCTFDEGGNTLLWLIVHHRLYLSNNTIEDYNPTLLNTFIFQNVLRIFHSLIYKIGLIYSSTTYS